MRKPIHIDMAELQGEGAFVECAVPTVGEVLEFLKTDGDYPAGARLVADHVTAWNLTDGKGDALELPNGDPEKVANLSSPEFRRVVDHLLGQTDKTKN